MNPSNDDQKQQGERSSPQSPRQSSEDRQDSSSNSKGHGQKDNLSGAADQQRLNEGWTNDVEDNNSPSNTNKTHDTGTNTRD